MLVDLSKDEISLILHHLEEYDLDGNGNVGFDPEYREEIYNLQSKLEPILDACQCKEQNDTYNKINS